MRMILAMLTIVTLAACTSKNPRLVYSTADTASTVTLPPGFRIFPAEAQLKVLQERRLSLKHNWDVYADDHNYYVIDTFLGSSPRRARKTGIIIDGKTGEFRN